MPAKGKRPSTTTIEPLSIADTRGTVFSIVHLFKNHYRISLQRGEIFFNDIPNNSEVDIKISMNKPVP